MVQEKYLEMNHNINLNDIRIRTELIPGDIGYIIYLHSSIYRKEYNYGIEFEVYVAAGLVEFWHQYDPLFDRVWICEYENKIIGFLLLMHRKENSAQLRYFLIKPEFRGIGLGRKLMDLFMDFVKERGYKSVYLWTTNEQKEASILYKKYGFTLTEELESSIFGKKLIEQKYEIRL